MEDKNLLKVNVIIHGFAIVHATTAAALSQTMVGDEAALTALTISMIIAISQLYNQRVEVGEAFAFLGIFAGWYIGTRTAVMFVKWMPVIGNSANAIATAVTTEILGWATYLIVREKRSITTVDKTEMRSLIRQAKEERIKQMKIWKRIKSVLAQMNEEDKSRYESIMKKFTEKNLSEAEQNTLEQELQELLKKYGLTD